MSVWAYRTPRGVVLQVGSQYFDLTGVDWDDLFCRPDEGQRLAERAASRQPLPCKPAASDLLPPIGSQEVWAAGVTYYRSRSARMEESSEAGGGDFYDRVYSAPRPELFFKASPHRVVGPRGKVRIRGDARWNVPEPELAVCVSPAGKVVGYTVGNDMSSRDIEGENPLYLPQAKVYDGCCALGPGILLTGEPLDDSTEIELVIRRNGKEAFSGKTQLAQMKRRPAELIGYLLRDNSFPAGCFLLTGTGVVPPNDFTLQSGDQIRITIEPIGTLENTVA
ncbi:MAG: fumarylacetoacetate hydrolase family protein [Pirellulales bacterium]|nr:fumarylacetoacetate hydrolase family protein [Pirellulales bacterium]